MGFSRERVHVLLSLDSDVTNLEASSPRARVRKGGDYPQSVVAPLGRRARVLHVARPLAGNVDERLGVSSPPHRRHPLGPRIGELKVGRDGPETMRVSVTEDHGRGAGDRRHLLFGEARQERLTVREVIHRGRNRDRRLRGVALDDSLVGVEIGVPRVRVVPIGSCPTEMPGRPISLNDV